MHGSPDLVGRLLPDDVEVVEGPIVDAQQFLLPEEASSIARAVEKRRLEFACGRHFARRAMKRFGCADRALPVGPGRAPIWPPGLIGSISHSDQYCAVAVAPTAQASAIGIDVEQVASFRPEIARLVLTASEIAVNLNSLPSERQLTGSAVIFSAKESLYKCLHPLTRAWLGFGDVEVRLDVCSRTFELRLLRSTGPFSANDIFVGRYAVDEGRVATALMLAPAAMLPALSHQMDESPSTG